MPAVQLTETSGAAAAGTVTPVGGARVPVVAVADPDPVVLQYASAGVAAAVATIAKIAKSMTRTRVLRATGDPRGARSRLRDLLIRWQQSVGEVAKPQDQRATGHSKQTQHSGWAA